MDKNQATGLILFAAVILIYSMFFASVPEPITEDQSLPNTEVQDAAASTPIAQQEPDSVVQAKQRQQFGDLSALTQGTEEQIILENEVLKVVLSSKGGEIKSVELKEYKTWDKEPLILMDENNASMAYQIQTRTGPVNLNDIYFEASSGTATIDEAPAQQVSFIANTGSGSIQRTYTLSADSYLVGHQVTASGNLLADQNLTIHWEDQLKKLEADIEESRRKSYINYYTTDDSYGYLGDGSSNEAEQVGRPLKWVSFKQRFFTAAIIADQQFANGNLASETPTDTLSVKNMSATLMLPLEGQAANMDYFIGPNNYQLLKKIAPEFDKNVDMGYFFVSWVNKYIIVNLFHLLEKVFSNYGVIIILIVFIIKLFLLPLTYKSYIGMAKMR